MSDVFHTIFYIEKMYDAFGWEPMEQKTNNISDRYKTLFEQVNAAVFLIDLKGKIMEVNLKAHDYFNYDFSEEHIFFYDLLTELIDWKELIEDIIAKGGFTFETNGIRKNKSQFPVEISTSLFRFQSEPVVLALVQDITDRRQKETLLVENEKKYRRLFESTNDGMIILDARGEIIEINKKAQEMCGRRRDEIVENNLLNLTLFSPQSIANILAQFEQLLNKEHTQNILVKMIDKNNQEMDVELSSFFLYQCHYDVDYFVLVLHDIQDRIKANKTINITNQILAHLLNNISESIYIKNHNNTFRMVNPMLAQELKSTPQDLIGKTEFDVLPKESALRHHEEDEVILRTGKMIINKEIIETYLDNTIETRFITKIPLLDESENIHGLLCIKR